MPTLPVRTRCTFAVRSGFGRRVSDQSAASWQLICQFMTKLKKIPALHFVVVPSAKFGVCVHIDINIKSVVTLTLCFVTTHNPRLKYNNTKVWVHWPVSA